MRLWIATGMLFGAAALAAGGCASVAFIFGSDTNGLFGGTVSTDSGGTELIGGGIPTATQPDAITGPTYTASLLDPLFEATAGAKAVVMADIDNDGVLDIVSISDESQPVQIHLRNTTTNLFDTLSIGGGAPITRAIDIEVGDFDADGRLDVAVLINDTGFAPPPNAAKLAALVLLFQGADPRNQFAWVRTVVVFKGCDEDSFTDMTVGDFDGVNGPDIILLSNEPEVQGVPDKFAYLFTNPGGVGARTG
ncbi:MAG: VCBS repeat-containing protein, partial [Phycisphaerae bacterium]